MKKRVSVLTNEECLEVGLLITPGWSKILEELTALGNGQDSPPVVEATSWNKLLSQLEDIQRERGYKPGWLIHNVLAAGKPPYWVLTAVAKIAGFNAKWAARQWNGVFDELPNVEAIEWELYKPQDDRYKPTAKPILKPKLASDITIKPTKGVH
jgi:hypothetical protein